MGVETVSPYVDDFDAIVSNIVNLAAVDPDKNRAIDALTFADNYRAYSLLEDELMYQANALRVNEQIAKPNSTDQELAIALRKCATVIRSIARNQKRDMRSAMSRSFQVPTPTVDVLYNKSGDLADDASELRWRARNAVRDRVASSTVTAGLLSRLANGVKAVKDIGSKIKGKVKQSKKLQSVVNTVRHIASSIKEKAQPIIKRLPAPVKKMLKKPAVIAGIGGAAAGLAIAGGTGLISKLKEKITGRSSDGSAKASTASARQSVAQSKMNIAQTGGYLEGPTNKFGEDLSPYQDGVLNKLGRGILAVTDFIGLPRAEEWRTNRAQAAGKTARAVGMWMAPGSAAVKAAWIGATIGEDAGGGFVEDSYKAQYQNGIINGTVSRPNCKPSGVSSFFGGLSGMYVSCIEKQNLYDQAYSELQSQVP